MFLFSWLLSVVSFNVFIHLYQSTKKWFCNNEPNPQPVAVEFDGSPELLDRIEAIVFEPFERVDGILRVTYKNLYDAAYDVRILNGFLRSRCPELLEKHNGVYFFLMPEHRIIYSFRWDIISSFLVELNRPKMNKIQDGLERLPFLQDQEYVDQFRDIMTEAKA